jgi:hypothetical protein
MDRRNYESVVQTNMRIGEVKTEVGDKVIPFIYFGVRVNDYIKTYKLSSYKLLYDFIFQNLIRYGKDELKAFVEEKFLAANPVSYREQSYPTRVVKNEFTMNVGRSELSFNENAPPGFKIVVCDYEMNVTNVPSESIKLISLKVPEVRLFSKLMSFEDETQMLLCSDFFFALSRIDSVKRGGITSQSDCEVD